MKCVIIITRTKLIFCINPATSYLCIYAYGNIVLDATFVLSISHNILH